MTCFDMVISLAMRRFVCRYRDLRLYPFVPSCSDLNRGDVDEL